MKIYEVPKCKCGEQALGIILGEWACGRCIEKYWNKKNEINKQILMEIQENGSLHR